MCAFFFSTLYGIFLSLFEVIRDAVQAVSTLLKSRKKAEEAAFQESRDLQTRVFQEKSEEKRDEKKCIFIIIGCYRISACLVFCLYPYNVTVKPSFFAVFS